MRHSRIILPSFVALSLMTGAAFSQQAPATDGNSQSYQATAPSMGPAPQNPLNLTDTQKEQVQQIMQEEHERTRERLSKVLTPEQMAQLDARREGRHGGPHGDSMGQPMPPPPSNGN